MDPIENGGFSDVMLVNSGDETHHLKILHWFSVISEMKTSSAQSFQILPWLHSIAATSVTTDFRFLFKHFFFCQQKFPVLQ